MKQVQRCSPEEKRHMIDLIMEMRGIVQRVPSLKDNEKPAVVQRLKDISGEMKQFRKRYPLD